MNLQFVIICIIISVIDLYLMKHYPVSGIQLQIVTVHGGGVERSCGVIYLCHHPVNKRAEVKHVACRRSNK